MNTVSVCTHKPEAVSNRVVSIYVIILPLFMMKLQGVA